MSHCVSALLQSGKRYLRRHGQTDSDVSSEQLLSHVLGRNRSSLYSDIDHQITGEKREEFFSLLKQRSKYYPLQYLIGHVYFRYVKLKVQPGVFIPRPESECLVDVVLNRLVGNRRSQQILDIGTGSGNLAVSLAVEIPNALVTATDCSQRALRLASQNAEANNVRNRVQFIRTKFSCGVDDYFDAVVSNPPYLSADDLAHLQPEVSFEPRTALNGGKDGLGAYREIINSAEALLKPRGLIVVEVGYGQAQAVSKMFQQSKFFGVETVKDLSGIDRIVSARKRSNG